MNVFEEINNYFEQKSKLTSFNDAQAKAVFALGQAIFEGYGPRNNLQRMFKHGVSVRPLPNHWRHLNTQLKKLRVNHRPADTPAFTPLPGQQLQDPVKEKAPARKLTVDELKKLTFRIRKLAQERAALSNQFVKTNGDPELIEQNRQLLDQTDAIQEQIRELEEKRAGQVAEDPPEAKSEQEPWIVDRSRERYTLSELEDKTIDWLKALIVRMQKEQSRVNSNAENQKKSEDYRLEQKQKAQKIAFQINAVKQVVLSKEAHEKGQNG